MKSLNDETETDKSFLNNEQNSNLFTYELITFIKKEGFVVEKNNTYNKEINGSHLYCKGLGDIGITYVNVYISSNGIAVDQDYSCGGNIDTTFFEFKIKIMY